MTSLFASFSSFLLSLTVLPSLFYSASALSVFSPPPEQRGQLLIPDKRLAFGAAGEEEQWERGSKERGDTTWGVSGLGLGVGWIDGRGASVETARSEKGSRN